MAPTRSTSGREICINANETHLSVQDVTDKSNIKVVSHVTYPSVAYAHQGWFTDDHKYWYEDDELDEGGFNASQGVSLSLREVSVEGTRTLIVGHDRPGAIRCSRMSSSGTTHATDHNQYVKGNRLFQSNYRAGLRILDISDPCASWREVGFLDTYPYDDNKEGGGTWSNYPYFKNGLIGVTSITEGFFMGPRQDRANHSVSQDAGRGTRDSELPSCVPRPASRVPCHHKTIRDAVRMDGVTLPSLFPTQHEVNSMKCVPVLALSCLPPV